MVVVGLDDGVWAGGSSLWPDRVGGVVTREATIPATGGLQSMGGRLVSESSPVMARGVWSRDV